MYLDDEALGATLRTVAACSAAGSTLIVEYHDADAPKARNLYSFVRTILLALWSEPQIGARSQPDMRAHLLGAGFRIEKDFGISQWGTTFARARSRPSALRARLAVATAGGAQPPVSRSSASG